MKPYVVVAGMFSMCLVGPLRAEVLVKPHDVVYVSADVDANPRMFSVDIACYFLMCQPVDDVQVIQSCQRYDGVEAFMKRVESDVAPWHATVFLISHGIGNGANGPGSRGLTYYNPTYLGNSVDELKRLGPRTIVVGSTACVDSVTFHNNPAEAKTWNDNLAAFRDSDRAVAAKAGVAYADPFTPMLNAMPKAKALYGDNYAMGGDDGMRLGPNSQLIMAYAFLKALGCDGAIGTITVDMAANKAEGTPGQRIISCQKGAVEVESTRYPFCFQGAPSNPESTSGIIATFPFNDELNRYLLVVKGLTGSRAKVTWGNQSQEFPAADLARGVNLAGAFAARTPFDGQFNKVGNALWEQQHLQAVWTDAFFHYQLDYRQMGTDAGPLVDQIATGIVADNRKRTAAIAALVVPIRHTLKIEALP